MKVYGTKLSTYVNNLFTTCDDMETALSQAAIIAGGADNAAAVHTAVHMVLNTAIKLHQSDMAAANAPLREMIEAEIQKAFTAVHTQVEHALENHNSAIDDRINDWMSDNLQGYITDNVDLGNMMQDWFDHNFDMETALSGVNVRINFD